MGTFWATMFLIVDPRESLRQSLAVCGPALAAGSLWQTIAAEQFHFSSSVQTNSGAGPR